MTSSPLRTLIKGVAMTGIFCLITACSTLPRSGSETTVPDDGFPWEAVELTEGVTWLSGQGYDPRFDSNQTYNLIEVDLTSDEYEVEFLWFYERTALLSQVANQIGALAAINTTYLEYEGQYFKSQDTVRQEIVIPEDYTGVWKHEGAVYRDHQGRFGFTYGTWDTYPTLPYPDLVSAGPLLILDNDPVGQALKERKERTHEAGSHPRTVIASKDDGQTLLLFTVDGRAEEAEGMTTPQLTELLHGTFNATGALNLDGGGTTTMWIQGKTSTNVVNYPSGNGRFDHYGERWSGNGLVILPANGEPGVERSGQQCEVVFPDGDTTEEHYIYLGDQLHGVMDMPAGQDFTLSLWVKPSGEANGKQALLNKRAVGEEGLSRGYEIYLTENRTIEALFDTGNEEITLTGEIEVAAEQWSHVALTLSGTRSELYINGNMNAETSNDLLAEGFDNKHFLTAGAQRAWATENHEGRTRPHSPWGRSQFSFTSYPYSGSMDGVQVWHRALASDEIGRLAEDRQTDEPAVNQEGLVSFWTFNDLPGSFARDETGKVHGTYMGGLERLCLD